MKKNLSKKNSFENIDFGENKIVFKWIKTHNLKNIDLEFPKNKIIAITWVSGSWKSSLAFDTIYKEWQHRYIESLSSYLRQFFNLWTRPELIYASWLSPAVAIEQNKRVWNSRSTVWTLTEIDDYIRLMFAKLWDIYCHSCWVQIKPKNIDTITDEINKKYKQKKVYLLDELLKLKLIEDFNKFVQKNRKKVDSWQWYIRFIAQIKFKWDDNIYIIEYFYLEQSNIDKEIDFINVYWIFDRISIEEKNIWRMKEDIIKILLNRKKFWVLLIWEEKINRLTNDIDWFTDKNYCAKCNITYPEFTTEHFSPNRPEWACEKCHWTWNFLKVDLDKIIDENVEIKKAILPWRDSSFWQAIIDKLCEKYSINKLTKRKDLSKDYKNIILNWDNDTIRIMLWWKIVSLNYNWVEDILTQQYNKWILTVDFQAMFNLEKCPLCEWARLKRESLNVFLEIWKNKLNIFNLQKMKIIDIIEFLNSLINKWKKSIDLMKRILSPLMDRCDTINWLWLWYLIINRQIETLSWWEIQRLRLAKQLWNRLTWIIYVLDEPTIWLDENEIKKTINAISKLKDMWNTIIVVEHNDEFIKNADWVIEIWPWAWDFWWEVVFNWPYDKFLKCWSLTSLYITWKKQVEIKFEHKLSNKILKIKNARKNNLKNINIDINLWWFTIITWPSWAWKTTLMFHTLFKFLSEKQKQIQSYIRYNMLKKWKSWNEILTSNIFKQADYESFEKEALIQFYNEIWVDDILWYEHIENVIYVDQWNIWKTPRSCPWTFIWAFDNIRKIFAWSEWAKMFQFTPWHFSFNSWKWACPDCEWYWYKKIELQFLPDTYVPCDLCHWKRYKPEILNIKWRWKNISEVLNMYVHEATDFFCDIPFIYDDLKLMCEIWLWYLKMWQPAHTLSGWESQRIKLIKHLLKNYRWHTVYFLDEPTVWLHHSDIEKLLQVLKKFLDKWDTILMIEHDKSLLKFADKIIKLNDWYLITN